MTFPKLREANRLDARIKLLGRLRSFSGISMASITGKDCECLTDAERQAFAEAANKAVRTLALQLYEQSMKEFESL